MPTSWNEDSNKRRDFRQSNGEPEPKIPKHQNKKDTKKWCKGKEGREHEWILDDYFPHLPGKTLVEKCSLCGKQGKIYFMRFFSYIGKIDNPPQDLYDDYLARKKNENV
jgi:hypothetical protein